MFSVNEWAVLKLVGAYFTLANRKRGSNRRLAGSVWRPLLGVDTLGLDEAFDGSRLFWDRSSRELRTDGCRDSPAGHVPGTARRTNK